MPPLISIVVPVFNDAETIAAALESCLSQTLPDIEVICVDDASTDASVSVVERFIERDPRVRLLRQPANLSALQARRAGVFAARAGHVLFLDGDDELAPQAASAALRQAMTADADIVGFGVTVIGADGATGGRYEQRLQPMHSALAGADVLRGLFPIGVPAQGQLWRYLFRTDLLRAACAELPDDLALTRVNDLPLMFLVAALATRYVSIPDRLYRYHLGRGGSGHRVDSAERAQFYVGAIASVDSIAAAVGRLDAVFPDADLLRDAYASVRDWIIAYVCHQLVGRSDSSVIEGALAHLYAQASLADIVRASLRYFPESLTTLRFHVPWQDLGGRPVRSVLLATSSLRTGGVSAVLLSQARHLRAAGMRVTIVARKAGNESRLVPDDVDFVELTGTDLAAQINEWVDLCRDRDIDVVIDHQVLYTPHWPEFALAARAAGATTIGWVHNFVGRPLYDGTDRLDLLEKCSALLARVVVLSPLDVAYFKLRGVPHALYAPNPPSPLMIDAPPPVARTAPVGRRLELVWWGRLEERTKKISELLDVAEHLRDLDLDFRLTIIGPAWEGLTPENVNGSARSRGLRQHVTAIGPLDGASLAAAIDAADVFVSTSIIEGYQLTIAEAQSRGLPVFMYDLPWLTLVKDNPGVVPVPQGDSRALALRLAETVREPERYSALSRASLGAADRPREPEFGLMYREIVSGTVTTERSPEPTIEAAGELLGLMQFYAQRAPTRRVLPATRLSDRAWRSVDPAGQALLRLLPPLRPLARRTKHWLRRQ